MRFVVVAICALTAPEALADAPTVLFSPNGGVRETILSELGNARCSLDVAMYSFSDKGIWDAMVARAREGVRVRLLLNRQAFTPSVSNCPQCEAAEAAGVDIRYVKPTLHHKFALVDSQAECTGMPALLTGSGNWSKSSPTLYDEDFLDVHGHGAENEAFSEEYGFLWTHSEPFGTGPEPAPATEAPRTPSPSVFFTSFNLEPRQTAQGWAFRSRVPGGEKGTVGGVLLAAIDGATSTIDMASAHFRRFDIYEALVRASQRGVKVRMVLDSQELYPARAACDATLSERPTQLEECLERAAPGTEVRYKISSPRYTSRGAKLLHSKYMVVDGRQVLTGSFNLSLTSEMENFENLMRVEIPEVVLAYENNFEKVFNYGQENFESLLQQVAAAQGQGPCAFEPLSLTASAIWQLRRAYASGACGSRP